MTHSKCGGGLGLLIDLFSLSLFDHVPTLVNVTGQTSFHWFKAVTWGLTNACCVAIFVWAREIVHKFILWHASAKITSNYQEIFLKTRFFLKCQTKKATLNFIFWLKSNCKHFNSFNLYFPVADRKSNQSFV